MGCQTSSSAQLRDETTSPELQMSLPSQKIDLTAVSEAELSKHARPRCSNGKELDEDRRSKRRERREREKSASVGVASSNHPRVSHATVEIDNKEELVTSEETRSTQKDHGNRHRGSDGKNRKQRRSTQYQATPITVEPKSPQRERRKDRKRHSSRRRPVAPPMDSLASSPRQHTPRLPPVVSPHVIKSGESETTNHHPESFPTVVEQRRDSLMDLYKNQPEEDEMHPRNSLQPSRKKVERKKDRVVQYSAEKPDTPVHHAKTRDDQHQQQKEPQKIYQVQNQIKRVEKVRRRQERGDREDQRLGRNKKQSQKAAAVESRHQQHVHSAPSQKKSFSSHRQPSLPKQIRAPSSSVGSPPSVRSHSSSPDVPSEPTQIINPKFRLVTVSSPRAEIINQAEKSGTTPPQGVPLRTLQTTQQGLLNQPVHFGATAVTNTDSKSSRDLGSSPLSSVTYKSPRQCTPKVISGSSTGQMIVASIISSPSNNDRTGPTGKFAQHRRVSASNKAPSRLRRRGSTNHRHQQHPPASLPIMRAPSPIYYRQHPSEGKLESPTSAAVVTVPHLNLSQTISNGDCSPCEESPYLELDANILPPPRTKSLLRQGNLTARGGAPRRCLSDKSPRTRHSSTVQFRDRLASTSSFGDEEEDDIDEFLTAAREAAHEVKRIGEEGFQSPLQMGSGSGGVRFSGHTNRHTPQQ